MRFFGWQLTRVARDRTVPRPPRYRDSSDLLMIAMCDRDFAKQARMISLQRSLDAERLLASSAFGRAEQYVELAKLERERADQREAQLRELAAGLARHGHHIPPCPRWTTAGTDEACTCGLEDALVKARRWTSR